MAFDKGVAQRVREVLDRRTPYTEKMMFGGLAFMVRGNMCLGILGETLMARVGPQRYEAMLERKHVRIMDFTGRPLAGYVYVDPAGFDQDAELEFFVDACLSFNKTLPAK